LKGKIENDDIGLSNDEYDTLAGLLRWFNYNKIEKVDKAPAERQIRAAIGLFYSVNSNVRSPFQKHEIKAEKYLKLDGKVTELQTKYDAKFNELKSVISSDAEKTVDLLADPDFQKLQTNLAAAKAKREKIVSWNRFETLTINNQVAVTGDMVNIQGKSAAKQLIAIEALEKTVLEKKEVCVSRKLCNPYKIEDEKWQRLLNIGKVAIVSIGFAGRMALRQTGVSYLGNYAAHLGIAQWLGTGVIGGIGLGKGMYSAFYKKEPKIPVGVL
jgi:hypothetical protein